MPQLQISVTHENGTKLEHFQEYVELRYMNASRSSDEHMLINGELMPRKGTSDNILRENNSTLVLYTIQFPNNTLYCTDVSNVHVRVHESDSPNGKDVKLYLVSV